MSEKLCKKEVKEEKNQKQVREPVPLCGNPGSSTKTHTGTGSPKLGTGFQGTLPKSRTNKTQQEPVPPNWEPGSRALCPSHEPAKHSRNRFPQTGNRVPGHFAQVTSQQNTAGTGSPKLGTGFQSTLPQTKQHTTQQEPVPPKWE